MQILVVCGAGASSTFVAQRVRRAAEAAGLPHSAFAGTVPSLEIDLDSADVVLVGPHLDHALEAIERTAASRAVTVVLLPADIFTDFDGTRALALARAAVEDREATPPVSGATPTSPDGNRSTLT